jgi:DNA-binding transcriptional ArsR family regulator
MYPSTRIGVHDVDEIASAGGPVGSDAGIDWARVPDGSIPARVVAGGRAGDGQAWRGRSRFVMGPLPMGWIGAAARCGDARALPVLLALKAKADAGRETWTKPPATVLQDLGVGRMARSRAIAALERAGLVEVRRRRGRPPLVRLVPWRDREGG